jgi:hypothetical protein
MEKQQHTASTAKHTHTGASNLEFDLFAEIYSLLKGNNALQQYMEDAKREGDKEAETCFQTLHQQNEENVAKLRGMIAKRVARA